QHGPGRRAGARARRRAHRRAPQGGMTVSLRPVPSGMRSTSALRPVPSGMRSTSAGGVELWGGPECSYVRVGTRAVDQIERPGHGARLDGLERVAGLGVRAFRQAVLWERAGDWGWADERVGRLRELHVLPILGLLHHGSGPGQDHLLSPTFVAGLA